MGTMTKISSGADVIEFLKEQHEQVKTLFTGVLAAQGKERIEAFRQLRRMLAVHETAEEEIVHPAARSLPGGDAMVADRLKEEQAAKTALVELEKLDVDSSEFASKFQKLQAAVLAHAESEETLEFDRLRTLLDPPRLQRMQKAVAFAESVAPTRPHPGIESATANVLAGPFASMVDRARDALAGKA